MRQAEGETAGSGRPPRQLDLAELSDLLVAGQGTARRLIGIAGPPGAGKSTFADRLRDALVDRVPTEVLAMDGFHYDDRVLEARGDRPRKGAPHTFDVEGFGVMLARVAADDGRDVALPVFDREIEIARAGARIVTPDARLILVEGNYLLLDDPAWAPLRRHFALTVFLSVPEPELEARLTARWRGLGLAGEAMRAKMEDNDLPNMRLVLHRSVTPDVLVANVDGI
jgi:pantothenate kinase